MKRLLAILTALCLLGAAGCSKPKEPEQPAAEPVQIAAAPAKTADPEKPAAQVTEEPAPEPAVPKSGLDVQPEIAVQYKYFYDYDSKANCGISVSYPVIRPKLGSPVSDAVDRLNVELEARAKKDFDDLKQTPMQSDIYSETHVSIVRYDDEVLSILLANDYYAGGPHPWRSYSGRTYDTVTGQPLSVGDVVRSEEDLAGLLDAYIRGVAGANEEEYAGPSASELLSDGSTQSAWVVGYDGLGVYVDAGTCMSYAAGEICAFYPFALHQDLFEKRMLSVPSSWGFLMIPDCDFLYGDDPAKTVRVMAEPYFDGDVTYTDTFSGLRVVPETGMIEMDDMWFYSYDSYFVHTPSGDYVYVVTSTDNDYTNMEVFDVGDGATHVGTSDGSDLLLLDPITEYFGSAEDSYGLPGTFDPGRFILTSRMDVLSTVSGHKAFHTGLDGMPETTDPYFMVDPFRLTSKVKMTFQVIEPETGKLLEQKSYPAGTVFTAYRTDKIKYLDATDPEGSTVRMECSFSWPQTVSGIDAEEVFDGMMYAG